MKYFENHHGAIHHVATDLVFEVARLRRGNLVIYQHKGSLAGVGAGLALCCFTCCDRAVACDEPANAFPPALC